MPHLQCLENRTLHFSAGIFVHLLFFFFFLLLDFRKTAQWRLLLVAKKEKGLQQWHQSSILKIFFSKQILCSFASFNYTFAMKKNIEHEVFLKLESPSWLVVIMACCYCSRLLLWVHLLACLFVSAAVFSSILPPLPGTGPPMNLAIGHTGTVSRLTNLPSIDKVCKQLRFVFLWSWCITVMTAFHLLSRLCWIKCSRNIGSKWVACALAPSTSFLRALVVFVAAKQSLDKLRCCSDFFVGVLRSSQGLLFFCKLADHPVSIAASVVLFSGEVVCLTKLTSLLCYCMLRAI